MHFTFRLIQKVSGRLAFLENLVAFRFYNFSDYELHNIESQKIIWRLSGANRIPHETETETETGQQ